MASRFREATATQLSGGSFQSPCLCGDETDRTASRLLPVVSRHDDCDDNRVGRIVRQWLNGPVARVCRGVDRRTFAYDLALDVEGLCEVANRDFGQRYGPELLDLLRGKESSERCVARLGGGADGARKELKERRQRRTAEPDCNEHLKQ